MGPGWLMMDGFCQVLLGRGCAVVTVQVRSTVLQEFSYWYWYWYWYRGQRYSTVRVLIIIVHTTYLPYVLGFCVIVVLVQYEQGLGRPLGL